MTMGNCSAKPLVDDSKLHRGSIMTTDTNDSHNHFKTDAVSQDNNAVSGENTTLLESFRVRASSFASSASDPGVGLAAEALSTAIGAAMRDVSPNKGQSSRRRSKSNAGTDPLPGAAAQSPRQSQGGLPPVKSPAPPPSLDGDTTSAESLQPRGSPGSSPPPAIRNSDNPRRQGDRGFNEEGASTRRRTTQVTFEDLPNSGRRKVVRNKSRLKMVAGPTTSCPGCDPQEQSNTDSPDEKLIAALPSHKSVPLPLPPPPPAPPLLPAAKGGASEPGLWVLRRTGNVRSKYIMADSLGRGQFGAVCVAMDRSTGDRWACKSVSKRRVQGMHDFSMTDVLREVEVLYTVGGHQGVVGLKEVYEDDEDLHLIMELCQGGDWFERLINFGRYTEAEAAATIRAVLEALSYCHSLGVMHRDIKPENIMFVDRTDTSAVKLTDFGLAAMFVEGTPLSEVLGSAYYVAPEVLKEKYGKEADIWSTGIVLFIALGGYAPFDGANEREVFTKILNEPLSFKDPSWNHISPDAKHIINRMLTKDPAQRATVKELLAHSWFATCAGTLTPSVLASTPVGSLSLPQSAAQALAAAVKQGVNSGPVQLDLSFTRRLPRGSIAKAVATAVKRGKIVKTVPDAVVARLQQFTAMNAFKRQARRVLATYLPEEEVVGLMQVFKAMDADGDGVLTIKELQTGLAARGVQISDNNAKLLLQRTDMDGDGSIDYIEFLAATLHLARLERDERLYRAFRHFDVEGCGFITRENIEAGLAHLNRVNIDRILSEVDVDGDGRICYAEFCDMLRNDTEPAMAMLNSNNAEYAWAAWGEETESGRIALAMPPDSLAPSRNISRNTSLAASRQHSGNDRTSYASIGAVSIRRSLGGNLLFGSRNARASGTGAPRPSHTGRPSYAGSAFCRPSAAGSSRFGSMRAAALAAIRNGEHSNSSGRSSLHSLGSCDFNTPLITQASAPQTLMTARSVQRMQEVLDTVKEGDSFSTQGPLSDSWRQRLDAPLLSVRVGNPDYGHESHSDEAPSSPFALRPSPMPATPSTPTTAWGEPNAHHEYHPHRSPGTQVSMNSRHHRISESARLSGGNLRQPSLVATVSSPNAESAIWQQIRQVAQNDEAEGANDGLPMLSTGQRSAARRSRSCLTSLPRE